MKDLKFNGMNWTDNIYHKIEGIVPEVSDIKIQDKFKYVENQVITVGGTFKKICSVVVQDFFPLSTDPVKSGAKEGASKGNVAVSTDKCTNSEINIVHVSSNAEMKQSLVEIDAFDHADKHFDNVTTEHHEEDKLRNAKSTDSVEDLNSILAARKNNFLIKENSNLSNDVDSIKESSDGQLEDTFKYVEDHAHAVGGAFKKFCSDVVQDFFPLSLDPVDCQAEAMRPEGDAAVSTDGNNKSGISMVEVSSDAVDKQSLVPIDAVDHSHGHLCHVSTGHDANVGEFENVVSMNSHEKPDSILTPEIINVLTNENSGTSMVEVFSDAVDKQSLVAIDAVDHSQGHLCHASTGHDANVGEFENAVSMNSHEKPDSILTLEKINVLTNENSDLGNSDLGNDADAIKDFADERLELNSHGVTESLDATSLDIPADDTECDFGASTALSETACSIVSGEDTIKGTGLVFSDSLISRDSTSTPGCSSDISSPEECASDSVKRVLSSAASIMSTEDGAVEKHLVSSYAHLSVESNGDSSTVVADSSMETIDLCDEAKLGESCVFLDDSILYDVSRRARKLGSYKKKIQDIFASKKRLAKEYEQLAIWYGDANMDLSQDAAPFDSRNLQTYHAIDSEWELL